jgi:hypothetical protein
MLTSERLIWSQSLFNNDNMNFDKGFTQGRKGWGLGWLDGAEEQHDKHEENDKCCFLTQRDLPIT